MTRAVGLVLDPVFDQRGPAGVQWRAHLGSDAPRRVAENAVVVAPAGEPVRVGDRNCGLSSSRAARERCGFVVEGPGLRSG